MSQSVVLCEGYDDRAFWTGWLLRLGCLAASTPEERRDEWARPVTGGRYLFYTPGRDRILVEPCHGREQAPRAARAYFAAQATHPIRRLVINVDSDRRVGASEKPAVGRLPPELEQLAREAEGRGEGAASLEVLAVVWECADPDQPGIPPKQTLERLVASAIQEAYPGRGASVARWLEDPPLGDPRGAKAHGLSYAAKWYSGHGAEDFYGHVWRDEPVAAGLEERLRATGAWAAAERLIGS